MSAIRWHPTWGTQKWSDPRREEGLLKMVAVSLFFHFTIFTFAFFSQSFVKSRPSVLQGYHVSLVSPGGGGFQGGGGPPGGGAGSSGGGPAAGGGPSSSLTPKASPAISKKGEGMPTLSSPAPTRASVPSPRISSTERRSEKSKAPAKEVEKDDPERLQEWWKKKAGSIKIPPVQSRSVEAPIQESAKVDITRRPSRAETSPQSPSHPSDAKNFSPSGLSGAQGGSVSEDGSGSPSSVGSDHSGQTGSSRPGGPAGSGSGGPGGALVSAVVGGNGTGTGPGGGNGTGGGAGQGTGSGFGGPLFTYPYYLETMENKISGHWAPPPMISQEGAVDAIIRFHVKKNGQIESIEIEKSSGNRHFDSAALRAVHDAGSLPPFPAGLSEDRLTVHFSFTFQKGS